MVKSGEVFMLYILFMLGMQNEEYRTYIINSN